MGRRSFLPGEFVAVQQFVPDAVIDIRYAGTNNFTGTPVVGYYGRHAILTAAAAKALGKAADTLRRKNLRIIVYDAYRPCKAVKYFLHWAADPEAPGDPRFFPGMSKQQVVDNGYIAKKSAHSRGSTVDLGLCDMDGNELDMGGFFDFFGTLSHHGADLPAPAAELRNILLDAMTEAGFEPYQCEWWHYCLKNEPYPDRYWDFDITDDWQC